ncbi:Short chain dehydrogenase citE [Lachnellula suecica]|uniref:Short chain dehydrogenase citE n=1 Tax=Lachnellula suecica TaxID=602035 RepID=A0A8T9BZ07_9HELO|nr:Short chain dehydrogenase citE [Lachnellula suecica]
MPYPPVPVNNGKDFTKIVHHDTYPEIDPITKSDHSKHYVFITGASKGLGRVSAISFAKAGAAGIAIGARSDLAAVEQDLIAAAQAAGKAVPQILKLKLDVTNWDDVQNAAKETEKEFGRLDILINNAGYLAAFVPIIDDDRDEHWKSYEVNIRGVYWMCKAFLPLLLKGGEKTIVNLSSAGAHGIYAGASSHQTTKFALLRFTEYLMAENEGQGLLAYCINPGAVPSEMGLKIPPEMHFALVDTAELGADTLAFLTAERRDWLAGRYISVNWDVSELFSREDEIVVLSEEFPILKLPQEIQLTIWKLFVPSQARIIQLPYHIKHAQKIKANELVASQKITQTTSVDTFQTHGYLNLSLQFSSYGYATVDWTPDGKKCDFLTNPSLDILFLDRVKFPTRSGTLANYLDNYQLLGKVTSVALRLIPDWTVKMLKYLGNFESLKFVYIIVNNEPHESWSDWLPTPYDEQNFLLVKDEALREVTSMMFLNGIETLDDLRERMEYVMDGGRRRILPDIKFIVWNKGAN